MQPGFKNDRRLEFLPVVLALVVALASARPYAGGWNDGSRLATIEALVDQHTFVIDHSIFVEVPADGRPYPARDKTLRLHGTYDKLWIDGHFYSDKPPMPAVLAAGVYWMVQRLTGLTAREHTAWFCWLMTVLNSGLVYVLAVASMGRAFRLVRLPAPASLLLTLAFALGSFALCYTRSVNSHILLLGLTAAMLPPMLRWGEVLPLRLPWLRLIYLGALGGLAYAAESAAGPLTLVGLSFWVLFRCWRLGTWPRRLTGVALFGLAVLPCFAAHHAITFAVAGTLGPANRNPEFFNWPDCPFTPDNLTGHWAHPTVWAFLVYALDLLFGKRGFFGNNLMLLVLLVGGWRLCRRGLRERPELLCGLFWSAAIFLIYTATSNNHAGNCVSIRWFLPLLAPAFLGLAVLLREYAEYRRDCWILCGWSLPWALACWWVGPWWRPPLIGYWIIMVAGLVHWWADRHLRCAPARSVHLLAFRKLVPRWSSQDHAHPMINEQ